MGVRVEMPSNQPIVLLKELDGVRYLPIWLGAVEATAIAFAQQEVIPPRPLTHDLFKDVLGQLGAKLNTVYLTEIKDGIFYAQLNFQDGPAVSARPSDAIALALRIGVPILASEDLLEAAGIEIPDQAEDEVERFKEFLDQINPEDFLS
jgi:bifunctional DNase/RNase